MRKTCTTGTDDVSLHRFQKMVPVAQLVRASVCGIEGRGFEPHRAPL